MEQLAYMIHACPERMWYVNEYLVPQMIEQGIPTERILIRCDTARLGNLFACLERFKEAGKRPGGTWHIQDDVLLCRDFYERTKDADKEIMCGYMYRGFETLEPIAGRVPALYMWNSFPCIYIPNAIAREFVWWFYSDAVFREQYLAWVTSKKHDDGFFKDFITEDYDTDYVINLKPALVEHVDYLIGGSAANMDRDHSCSADYWDDPALVEELKVKLANR